MLRYRINDDVLKQALQRQGYKRLSHFAQDQKVNRMTLHHYLKGRGPLPENYYHICDSLGVDPLAFLTPQLESVVAEQEKIQPIIQALLRQQPDLAVGLIGSRARGRAKKYSDWDLGVTRGAKALTPQEGLRLKTLVEDAAENLPWFVDVVNLDQAPLWFLQKIDYQPVYLGGNRAPWEFFLGVLHGIQSKK